MDEIMDTRITTNKFSKTQMSTLMKCKGFADNAQ